ncbi:MAG: hypothetical protein JWQ51_1508 [Tardiphaga sp.]|nr:hypothetical protein [Tardiphaga sp.]
MTATGPATHQNRKAIWWLATGAIALLVLAANAHLVYMAFVSQPDCVSHLRRGAVTGESGTFSAASSSCTPH